ncbi:SRPBCC family protein [Flavobacterium sp.]|uniref:SRPBCC family protein n=1 Tax=Flavobacterium sp. TaxID=239 RepID=UPI003D0F3A93
MKAENNHFAKAEMLIRKPVSEVFQAFTDPEITRKFWFTKGSGKLEQDTTTEWTWEMYGFSLTVTTLVLHENKKIVIEWGNPDETTLVEWVFSSLDENETFVSITNSGLKGDADKIIDQVRNSTEGFTLVLAGAKAYLEHNILLNLVLDRFPKGFA